MYTTKSIFFLMLLIAILIPGCGSSPDAVVLDFVQKIKADDTEGAKKLTTDSMSKKLTTAKAFFDLIGFQPSDIGLDSYTKDNLASDISGDTARVYRKDKSFLVFVLVKQSGAWKIDRFDTNIKLPDLGGTIRDKFQQRREIK
jgi:hypothetical protein